MGLPQFLIEFRHARGAETLCADRIHSDGRGHLLLYHGTNEFRSLNLARIQDLRILVQPYRPHQHSALSPRTAS